MPALRLPDRTILTYARVDRISAKKKRTMKGRRKREKRKYRRRLVRLSAGPLVHLSAWTLPLFSSYMVFFLVSFLGTL